MGAPKYLPLVLPGLAQLVVGGELVLCALSSLPGWRGSSAAHGSGRGFRRRRVCGPGEEDVLWKGGCQMCVGAGSEYQLPATTLPFVLPACLLASEDAERLTWGLSSPSRQATASGISNTKGKTGICSDKKGEGGTKASSASNKLTFLIPRCSQERCFSSPVSSCLAGTLTFCGSSGSQKNSKFGCCVCLCKASAALCGAEERPVDVSCVYALRIFAVLHFRAPERGFTGKLRQAWKV